MLIKLYFSLALFSLSAPTIGQIMQIKNEVAETPREISFLDSTFVWTENHLYCCAGGSQSFKYTFDSQPTMLAGKTYFELLQAEEENSEEWGNTGNYIRSENNVVYLYQSPNEVELYNFNLMIGDTFQYALPEIVDSINNIILLNGEIRKQWKLRCIYDDPETAIYSEWIQGIGNVNGLFAVNDATNCSADGDGSDIVCMYRNDTLIYDDPLIDGCWFLPTTTQEVKQDFIVFAPNPTTDFINILGLKEDKVNIRIYNVMGQQVCGIDKKSIDVRDFSPGYYYAFILFNDRHSVLQGFIKY
ncbi:MAG: T9SS type A sorting domain-containing protein [Saprospiraceae bacterium]|uniref:T9SS type A sorting domain-containing protein n=1 Tax=Candidatus Opimibacter skivensis TaxID=2982028 RepID=A0A9D7SRQ2_9BACT|nr:T9SS type A sorting domain-containing protein [Candidatus Opimibacter skivensis]